VSKSSKKKNSKNPFSSLTWFDLELWAGSKILSRGKSYQRAGYVNELCITKAGELIAWVEGTLLYATIVWINGKELFSSCTCPYEFTCKHAVAVVLEYLNSLKQGDSLPEAYESDKRLSLIRSGRTASFEEDKDEYDYFNVEDGDEEVQVIGKSCAHENDDELGDFLHKKSKQELIELLIQIANRYPDIKHEMKYNARLSSGSVSTLVRVINREIDNASIEPGCQDYWWDNGYTPDYSKVKVGLQKLLDSGYADEVVMLGEKLFRKGIAQIGQIDDEGETAIEIADTLSIAFNALKICSKSDIEQMEFATDIELADDYDLCDGLKEFWKKKFEKEDWNAFADKLLQRLNEMKDESGDKTFHYKYLRDRLTDKILEALKNAGRGDEVIPLCEKEAGKTYSYVRLVKYLRKARRGEEAEEWIRKGIAATERKLPGISSRLRDELLDIRRRKRDWMFVAAIRADEFFESPSINEYKYLQKAAEKVSVWTEVRNSVINFLVTGKRPRHGDTDWPLPDTELKISNSQGGHKPPFTKVLIDISIREENIDEILRWYEIYHKRNKLLWGWTWEESIDAKVADAVVTKYPERSLEIWKRIAENFIALKKPKWYSTASKFLRKIEETMKRNGMDDEWQSYIAKLKEEHARKRRFIEILDSMTGKPIIES